MGVKRFLKVSVFLLALALLTFASAIITMKMATWSRTVVVPDVSGKDLASAITAFKDAGLDIKVERQEHHPSVPAGSVIQQNPLPGTTAKKGRNVAVVVSLGSEEVNVPSLTGDVVRRVQVVLKNAGLTLGDVARVSSSLPAEVVLAQDPPGASIAQKEARVDLLVSSGPEHTRFITPDLACKGIAEALAVMKPMEVGVQPAATGKAAAPQAPAAQLVVAQDPKPGFPIEAGGKVNVTMGAVKAPPPVPAKTPPTIKPQAVTPAVKPQAAVPVPVTPVKPPAQPPAAGHN